MSISANDKLYRKYLQSVTDTKEFRVATMKKQGMKLTLLDEHARLSNDPPRTGIMYNPSRLLDDEKFRGRPNYVYSWDIY